MPTMFREKKMHLGNKKKYWVAFERKFYFYYQKSFSIAAGYITYSLFLETFKQPAAAVLFKANYIIHFRAVMENDPMRSVYFQNLPRDDAPFASLYTAQVTDFLEKNVGKNAIDEVKFDSTKIVGMVI